MRAADRAAAILKGIQTWTAMLLSRLRQVATGVSSGGAAQSQGGARAGEDWRAHIDRGLQEQEGRTQRARQERWQAAIDEHRRKVRCHYCGEPSNAPLPTADLKAPEAIWNPTNLGVCKTCQKFACLKEHFHSGYCILHSP